MEDTAVSYNIIVPGRETRLFNSLAKKMGWKAKRVQVSGIEKGLDDIRKGNVYHAKDASDMIAQILGDHV